MVSSTNIFPKDCFLNGLRFCMAESILKWTDVFFLVIRGLRGHDIVVNFFSYECINFGAIEKIILFQSTSKNNLDSVVASLGDTRCQNHR